MPARQATAKPVIEIARPHKAPWAPNLHGCDPSGHVYRVILPYGNQLVGYVRGTRETALCAAKQAIARTLTYGAQTLTQKHRSRAMTVSPALGNPGRPKAEEPAVEAEIVEDAEDRETA